MKDSSKIALGVAAVVAITALKKKGAVSGVGKVGKSEFRHLYNMPYSTFDLLNKSGIIWVKTYDYNGKEVYEWYEPEYETIYINNKQYIDSLGKDKGIIKHPSNSFLSPVYKTYPHNVIDKVKDVFF